MHPTNNTRRLALLLSAVSTLLLAAALTISLPVSAVSATPTPVPTATREPEEGCQHAWFFETRYSPVCPAGPPVQTTVAVLEFERGTAFWIGAEGYTYILYRDWQAPYWERYHDDWLPGTAERDPTIVGPLGLWQQPRRGIGQAWRDHPEVRERLGWALTEWETVYTGIIQHAEGEGAAVFFTDQDNKAYQLPANGGGWDLFSWLG